MIWKKKTTEPDAPYSVFQPSEANRLRYLHTNNVRSLDYLMTKAAVKAIPNRELQRRKNGVMSGGYSILTEKGWLPILVSPRGMGCYRIDFKEEDFKVIWRVIREADKYLASKIEVRVPIKPILPVATFQMLEQIVFDFYRAIDHLETTRGFGNVGLIFTGPPGVGKSETMRWIRERANDEFSRGCFHLGLAELQEALAQGKPLNSNNALFFIDDIDSNILRDRRKTRNPLTSQFLTCLDGMHKSEGRVMIVSTNEKINDDIDPALLRPGRFDHVIQFEYPTLALIQEFCDRNDLNMDASLFEGWSFARIDMFLAKFKVAEYMRGATLMGYYEQFIHEMGSTDPTVESYERDRLADPYEDKGY